MSCDEDKGETIFKTVKFEGRYKPMNSKSTLANVENSSNLKVVVVYTEPFEIAEVANGIKREVIELGMDGSFSFEINNGKSFFAYLVDESLDFKVKGLLGIGTGENQYWENISTKELDGEINLGNIAQQDGLILKAELSLDELKLNENVKEQIKRFSKLDDNIRMYANYANNDFKNFATTGFTFYYPKLEQDSWTKIEKYKYAGYKVYTIGKGFGENAQLLPPEDIILKGKNYNSSNPVSNNGLNGMGNSFNFAEFFKGEKDEDLPNNIFPGSIWKLNDKGATIGEYKLDFVKPIVGEAEEEKINVPIPVIKNEVPGAGKIINTSLKWQILENGEYVDFDINLLKDNITDLHIEFVQKSSSTGRGYKSMIKELKEQLSGDFKMNEQWWYAHDSETEKNKLDLVVVGFRLDCIFYTFMFEVEPEEFPADVFKYRYIGKYIPKKLNKNSNKKIILDLNYSSLAYWMFGSAESAYSNKVKEFDIDNVTGEFDFVLEEVGEFVMYVFDDSYDYPIRGVVGFKAPNNQIRVHAGTESSKRIEVGEIREGEHFIFESDVTIDEMGIYKEYRDIAQLRLTFDDNYVLNANFFNNKYENIAYPYINFEGGKLEKNKWTSIDSIKYDHTHLYYFNRGNEVDFEMEAPVNIEYEGGFVNKSSASWFDSYTDLQGMKMFYGVDLLDYLKLNQDWVVKNNGKVVSKNRFNMLQMGDIKSSPKNGIFPFPKIKMNINNKNYIESFDLEWENYKDGVFYPETGEHRVVLPNVLNVKISEFEFPTAEYGQVDYLYTSDECKHIQIKGSWEVDGKSESAKDMKYLELRCFYNYVYYSIIYRVK
jgi:hypothetical protein